MWIVISGPFGLGRQSWMWIQTFRVYIQGGTGDWGQCEQLEGTGQDLKHTGIHWLQTLGFIFRGGLGTGDSGNN